MDKHNRQIKTAAKLLLDYMLEHRDAIQRTLPPVTVPAGEMSGQESLPMTDDPGITPAQLEREPRGRQRSRRIGQQKWIKTGEVNA